MNLKLKSMLTVLEIPQYMYLSIEIELGEPIAHNLNSQAKDIFQMFFVKESNQCLTL